MSARSAMSPKWTPVSSPGLSRGASAGATRLTVLAILAVATAVLPGLAIPTARLHAQAELFEEGNRLYQQEDYQGALDNYLRIREAGFESPGLHYNIGNAYFKANELGRAILYYERARRLAPGDPDILANLELARSLGADEIIPLPRFWLFRVGSWWMNLFPRSLLIGLTAAGYLMAAGAVLVLVLRLGAASWARRAAAAGGIMVLLLGATLAVRETGLGQARLAVVLAAEVGVQSAPSDDPALQLFVIHEGTRVRVDRSSQEWLEVVLDDGKVGWVRAEVLEEV
ncbi:MAG: tetratricopeptide repeat protein [Gammaproteobacteria bacterium]|nr:tetratricopeptide repeat protein [Gammaproteobacteria bacterium]MYF60533.1 tetratricopeptide repeat protein [Gammaproteobacteria bacterium]